jgi:hypothetical protein
MPLNVLILVSFVMIFFGFPSCADASCEGVSPSLLLTAWYDPRTDELIKEVGDGNESHFVWSKAEQEVEMFELENNLFNKNSSLRWLQDDSKPAPEVAQNLRRRIRRLGHAEKGNRNKNLNTINIAGENSYKFLVPAMRHYVSQEKEFQLLKEQSSCPYHVKYFNGNFIVMADKFQIGLFPSRLPGDDRSKTDLLETRCFGHGSEIDVLTVHWLWECQGEGDVVIPLKRIANPLWKKW